METILYFLRDTLDGPLYIATVIICVILLFACIGYLAERKIKDKKEKEKYAKVENSSEAPSIKELSTPIVEGPTPSRIPVQGISSVSPVKPAVSNVVPPLENVPVNQVGVVQQKNTTPPIAPPSSMPSPLPQTNLAGSGFNQGPNTNQGIPEVTPIEKSPNIVNGSVKASPVIVPQGANSPIQQSNKTSPAVSTTAIPSTPKPIETPTIPTVEVPQVLPKDPAQVTASNVVAIPVVKVPAVSSPEEK